MNSRAQLVRRLSHDFWQRLRIALSYSGDDANRHVDRIGPDLVDDMAGDVCATLGIDYEKPAETTVPEVQGADKAAKARAASPWKKRGINLSQKRPSLSKD